MGLMRCVCWSVAVLLAIPFAPATANAEPATLVVYCGRSRALAAPLLREFERRTGIQVEVRYGRSNELQRAVRAEGEMGRADLLWLRDAGHLAWLSGGEWLAPLPADLTDGTDPRFHDRRGAWVGLSASVRVLISHGGTTDAPAAPRTLAELAAERWTERLAWAPASDDFVAHVSALRHAWGNDETRTWLQRMAESRPQAYPDDAAVVRAVADAKRVLGWVEYAAFAELDKPGMGLRASAFSEGDAGNLVRVSAAALRKGTPNQAEALRALRFLLGEWAQRYLAEDAHELPARSEAAQSDRFSLLARFHPRFVDPQASVDLVPTRVMLSRLALR